MDRILVLIVPDPAHCLFFTFVPKEQPDQKHYLTVSVIQPCFYFLATTENFHHVSVSWEERANFSAIIYL